MGYKTENKMKGLSLFVLLVIALSGLSMSKADSAKQNKIEKLLKTDWESIQYYKNVSVYNPRVSSNQRSSSSSENVNVNCKVEILDPNVILGTCSQAVITEITDSKGHVISSGEEFPNTSSMTYDGLRYSTKMVMPKRDPKWKQIMESVMRIRKETDYRPQMVLELQPNNLRIQLDKDTLQKAGSEIGSIKGYFYALSAGSLKNVDFPFEPNDNWLPITDYEEIKIKDVQRSGSSINYNIEERNLGGNQPFSLKVGDYLPRQIVTARQFLKDDGTVSGHFLGIQRIPAHVGGGGSMGGTDVPQITTIRFVIAEDPNHNKIPFELKNIPVPKP
jgi:hypothetical protein